MKLKYPWWVSTLAVLGAIALTGALITLFSSVGRRPQVLHPTSVPPVESPDFLLSVAGAAGVPIWAGGTVQQLDNGVEFFPALLEAIRGARQTINFAVYIWEAGQASDQVFAALIERARAGVQVRVLLDGMGGVKAPDEQVAALQAAGGQVQRFRPPRFGKLARFHKRNHRRSIVVDGTVAFTGGAAVGDKWVGNADSEEHWRDTMTRFTGPPAAGIQAAFVTVWAPTAGELLSGTAFFPPLPAVPDTSLRTIAVSSFPSSDDHPLRLFLLQTFLSARRTLYIATPYFVPDETLRRAVIDRARGGVDVRILLPDEHTDAKMIRRTSHKYYAELMAAGVRIYEYQPTMMHSKTVVVDGLWTVVGSANMDIRSHELNQENVVGVLDAAFAARVQAAFQRDLSVSSEIDRERWARRGLGDRFMERVSSLFAEQY
ncbi:MAG TPA: phospholipase D-like domain-containing protein [Vicinamibacteria bacterium]|nr:phospholipase D-like domain-containing protein [Vicinamibacteria bacterium]